MTSAAAKENTNRRYKRKIKVGLKTENRKKRANKMPGLWAGRKIITAEREDKQAKRSAKKRPKEL